MGTREGRKAGRGRSIGDIRQKRETRGFRNTEEERGTRGRGRAKGGGLEKPVRSPRWDPISGSPGRAGTGQGRRGLGWGAPSWDRSRAPVLTVHRGERVCFAVHIHGEAEEREQRGRRRRVASQTQLQDLRRKGRDVGEGGR